MDIQTSDQTPDQLEDKLRTMILGNVKNVSIPLPQRFPRNTPQLRINREPLPRKAQAQNVQDKGPYAPRKQHIQQSSGGPAQIQQPIQVAHRRPRMPPDAQQGQLNLLARQGQLPLARSSNYLSAPSKFQPLPRPQQPPVNVFNTQCSFLQHLAVQTLPGLHITVEELAAKDSFRCHLQEACQGAITMKFPLDKTVVSLAPFGSVGSGFAMPGSDMDLVMLLSSTEPYLPRLFEKALLDMGYGARLLTRTRVPIIKVCEKPQPELYAALCKERRKWDNMTAEEQEEYDHPNRHEDDTLEKDKPIDKDDELDQAIPGYHKMHALDMAVTEQKDANNLSNQPHNSEGDQPIQGGRNEANMQDGGKSSRAEGAAQETQDSQKPRWRRQKQWYRERHLSPLDFPKAGIGIQCDINFSNSLGIYNTLLLRCYSHCDPRVKPMVLFVKAWASRRKINSGYNNTLSSYGYVLMVLHFLVNVAQPPVCPNLQLMKRTGGAKSSTNDPHAECEGYDVRFWRDEAEIQNLAGKGMWRHNRDTLGMLLRNFFLYYARQGYGVVNGGFDWTRQVLSLRTKGGLLSKEEKGWTGAKMTVHDNMEVRQRYLFAIEDPFELDHNVARTVAHHGIVAIRDEFRRAWAILCAVGRDQTHGDFLEEMISVAPPPNSPNAADQRPTHKNSIITSMSSVKILPTNTSNTELVAQHTDVVASLGANVSLERTNDASPADVYENKVIEEHEDQRVVASLGAKASSPTRDEGMPSDISDKESVDEQTQHNVRIYSQRVALVPTRNDASPAEIYDHRIGDEHTDHHVEASFSGNASAPDP